MGEPTHALPARIASRIAETGDGCLVYDGYTMPKGYVQVWWDGRKVYLHRLAVELEKGPIPHGMQVDHLCRNRACCNPKHLEVVAARENVNRGENIAASRARQTTCQRGHPFTPENTYQRRRVSGGRRCRVCDRQYKYITRRKGQTR